MLSSAHLGGVPPSGNFVFLLLFIIYEIAKKSEVYCITKFLVAKTAKFNGKKYISGLLIPATVLNRRGGG